MIVKHKAMQAVGPVWTAAKSGLYLAPRHHSRIVLLPTAVHLIAAATAVGGNPTLSLKVTAINGLTLERPAKTITVAPDDVLTTKIFIRDWSPNGEKLRGVQAAIDDRGYTSGESGTIQPVDFATTTLSETENKDNAFVDSSDPRYVFYGGKDLSVVDTMSYGYRYLSVVVAEQDAPVSPQDGTEFACGTLKLKVSEDARGTFLLSFDESPGACGVRDLDNEAIEPLEFELLVVHVVTEGLPLRVISSDPPSGAIDARMPLHRGEAAVGWDQIVLKFNSDPSTLKIGDFTVQDGSREPPRVRDVSADGRLLTLWLDPGVRPLTWVTITHRDSGTGSRLGCLPGDVNNDGTVDTSDLLSLLEPTQTAPFPPYQADLDRNGKSGVGDVLALLKLMNESTVYCAKLP